MRYHSILVSDMAPLPCPASMQDWLCYKAQVYFVKADHNSMGFLDIWLEHMSNSVFSSVFVHLSGDFE